MKKPIILKKIALSLAFCVPLASLGMEYSYIHKLKDYSSERMNSLNSSLKIGASTVLCLAPEIMISILLFCLYKKELNNKDRSFDHYKNANTQTKEFVQEQLKAHSIAEWDKIDIKIDKQNQWAASDIAHTILVPSFNDFSNKALLLGLCDHEIYHFKHGHVKQLMILKFLSSLIEALIFSGLLKFKCMIYNNQESEEICTLENMSLTLFSYIHILTLFLAKGSPIYGIFFEKYIQRYLEQNADNSIRNDIQILKEIRNYLQIFDTKFKNKFHNTILFKISPTLAYYLYEDSSHPPYALRIQRFDQRIRELEEAKNNIKNDTLCLNEARLL